MTELNNGRSNRTKTSFDAVVVSGSNVANEMSQAHRNQTANKPSFFRRIFSCFFVGRNSSDIVEDNNIPANANVHNNTLINAQDKTLEELIEDLETKSERDQRQQISDTTKKYMDETHQTLEEQAKRDESFVNKFPDALEPEFMDWINDTSDTLPLPHKEQTMATPDTVLTSLHVRKSQGVERDQSAVNEPAPDNAQPEDYFRSLFISQSIQQKAGQSEPMNFPNVSNQNAPKPMVINNNNYSEGFVAKVQQQQSKQQSSLPLGAPDIDY